MRIIVTGGAGFIGSNLVRLLVNNGLEVLNIDKLSYAGNLASLSDVADKPNYRFAKLDICDAGALANTVQSFAPNAIVHLAAESHVDRSIDGPQDFIQTNIVGTYNLLQSSLAFYHSLDVQEKDAFRFLHVSTDEVYGDLGPTGSFKEGSRYDPHSPYAASKASADHLVRAWGRTYKVPVIVTHSSNNYGPYQFPEKLVPLVILKCLLGEAIPVFGSGHNVRDWLHVSDHCEALYKVLFGGLVGESYNIGGGCELANLDIVHSICACLDELSPSADGGKYQQLITFVADRPGHDYRYALDTSKITTEMSWIPKFDCATGIRETVKWYLSNENWWRPLISARESLQRRGTR